jgi:hypothetical protein
LMNREEDWTWYWYGRNTIVFLSFTREKSAEEALPWCTPRVRAWRLTTSESEEGTTSIATKMANHHTVLCRIEQLQDVSKNEFLFESNISIYLLRSNSLHHE